MQKIIYFTVPDELTRKDAIGSLAGTPIKIKKALTAIIPLFKPIAKPGPEDWLAENDEEGQMYEVYTSQPKNYVDTKRKVIYIQPLEDNIEKEFVKTLANFTKAYYLGLDVKVLPYFDLKKFKIESSMDESTQKPHYNAILILRNLQGKLPADAYCMMGICMTDLYSREESNWIFGIASLKDRTGVFSFARYRKSFFSAEVTQDVSPLEEPDLLWRSCKVLVHEIGHMFGMRHCIYFSCVMNGTNNLEEFDRKPMYLCPVCLRKLQHNIGFEIIERYEGLMNASKGLGEKFEEASKWYENVYNLILTAYGPHYKPKGSVEQNIEKPIEKESKK